MDEDDEEAELLLLQNAQKFTLKQDNKALNKLYVRLMRYLM